jgi:hypothetical protein
MHLLLCLLAFVAANGVEACHFASIKHTNNSRAVHSYLDRLVPVSRSVLHHELMGPKVGSDVNLYTSPVTTCAQH